jgi:3-oxoacyl-(acyl-carrier-protein) synthase
MAEAMPDRSSRVQLVRAADGTPELERAENAALQALKIEVSRSLSAKKQLGHLFAAAAATQMGLGAALTHERRGTKDSHTLVNCFGPGPEQASFLLEAV